MREEKVRDKDGILECVNVLAQGWICDAPGQGCTPPGAAVLGAHKRNSEEQVLLIVRVGTEVRLNLVPSSSYRDLHTALPMGGITMDRERP